MKKCAIFTVLLATVALCTAPNGICGPVRIELRPATYAIHVGEQVSVGIYLVSETSSSQSISATDIILTYDPSKMSYSGLSSAGAPYAWFTDGFFGSAPGGINTSLSDGDMQYSAWSQFGSPAQATHSGLLATTLLLNGVAPAADALINVPLAFGLASSDVFSADEANDDVLDQVVGADILIAQAGAVPTTLQLKGGADSTVRELQGPVVTRVFPSDNSFCMEDPSRLSAIRVVCRGSSAVPTEGATPSVFGVLRTINGERVFDEAVVVSHAGSGNIKPLGVNIRNAAQAIGVTVNALLMKVVGRVSVPSPTATEISIPYGPPTNAGLRIQLYGVAPPADKSFCLITGCVGSDATGRLLRVCHPGDIEVVPEGP